ncbi:MAG: rane fusion protein type secretion system, partial [Rhodospirillaceae bacterium]|nr:rane fusion protein type secretion system [Rhodospirillaceae bacterium]
MAAEDLLKRIDLIAPQDGKIFQRSVHTVGGVIQAGEVVMLVVPDSDALIIEAKVPPT